MLTLPDEIVSSLYNPIPFDLVSQSQFHMPTKSCHWTWQLLQLLKRMLCFLILALCFTASHCV